jgi:membrane fusion protein (multidrug efflux system)
MAAGPPDKPQPDQGQPAEDQGKPQDQGKPPENGGDKKPAEDGKDKPEEKKKPSPFKNPLVLAIIAVVLVVLLVGGLLLWLHARHFQSTDDAFVDVQIVRIAPQIAGQVTHVQVNDNQTVSAGQPLISIDSADADTKVAEAQAKEAQAQSQVDDARVQISVAKASYQQALADVASAAASADNAARDQARYDSLQATNPAAVAQQQLDQIHAQARTTQAQLTGANKAAQAKLAQVQAAETQVTSGENQVKAAQSELNAANINLGYASIRAPLAGTIAQKTVAPGNYVQPGTQLMAIVPLQLWVTANFKETQLDLMRPGQQATLKVDACPHDKITGHVDSIQRGAGQAFAILPPENATGNYVKVVQRVPVKVLIDTIPKTCPLGPGMSVVPKVRVR